MLFHFDLQRVTRDCIRALWVSVKDMRENGRVEVSVKGRMEFWKASGSGWKRELLTTARMSWVGAKRAPRGG